MTFAAGLRSALSSSKDRAATAITRGVLTIISLLADILNNICSNVFLKVKVVL